MASPEELIQKYGLKASAASAAPEGGAPGATTPDALIQKYRLGMPDLAKQQEPDIFEKLGTAIQDDDSPTAQEGKALATGTMALFQGAERAFAGVGQTGLELLAKAGITSPQLTEAFTRYQMEFEDATGAKDPKIKPIQMVGEGLTYLIPSTASMKIPELLGKGAPKIMRLLEIGTSAGVGGAISGTQFKELGDKADRWSQALKGAILGGAGEIAVKPLTALGVKIMGSQIVSDYIRDAQTFAANFKATGGEIVNSFKTKFANAQRSTSRAVVARNEMGNQAFPFLDTTKLVTELNELKSAGEKIGPEIKMLTSAPIKVGGRVITPEDPLYKQIVSKAPDQGGVNYERVAEVLDRLRARGKSTQAINKVQAYLDDLSNKGGPSLKLAAREARIRQENLETLAGPDFKDILKSTGPQGNGDTFFEANKKIIDMASGDDPQKAKRLYDALTPEGRESLRSGILFQALDKSMDAHKVVDPAKLSKVLDSEGAAIFFNTPRAKMELDGLRKVLTTASQQAGKVGTGQVDKLIHYSPFYAPIFGAYALARGEFEQGAKEIAMSVAVGITARTIGNALRQSQRARNFFAAASKVSPESAEGIRIFNRFMNAFGAVSGAETGHSKIGSSLLESGVEKGLETGADALGLTEE